MLTRFNAICLSLGFLNIQTIHKALPFLIVCVMRPYSHEERTIVEEIAEATTDKYEYLIIIALFLQGFAVRNSHDGTLTGDDGSGAILCRQLLSIF